MHGAVTLNLLLPFFLFLLLFFSMFLSLNFLFSVRSCVLARKQLRPCKAATCTIPPFYTSLVIQGCLNPCFIQNIIYKALSTLIRIFLKPHTFLHESASRPHETKYLFYTNPPPVRRRPHTFLHESAFHPHETAYPFTRYQPSLHTKPHTLLHKFGYSRLPVPLSHRKTIYKARSTRIRIFLKLHTVHTFLHDISLPSIRNSIPFYLFLSIWFFFCICEQTIDLET